LLERIARAQAGEAKQRMGDAVERGEARIEALVGILEHDLNVATAAGAWKSAAGRCRSMAVEIDGAFALVEQPADHPRGRALAGAGLADQTDAFARCHHQRKLLQPDDAVVEALDQVADLPTKAACHAPALPWGCATAGSSALSSPLARSSTLDVAVGDAATAAWCRDVSAREQRERLGLFDQPSCSITTTRRQIACGKAEIVVIRMVAMPRSAAIDANRSITTFWW